VPIGPLTEVRMPRVTTTTILVLAASVLLSARQERPGSPAGTASTVVGGKWIEVIYSRPMLRQRTNIFGTAADYGEAVRAGAPVWRAGANTTTVFKTEVPLVFGDKPLPAGEYGLLVDLVSPTAWTLILTSQPRGVPLADAANTTVLIGALNYNPKFDVVRAPMRVDSKVPAKLDQMTIYFLDVTTTGGTLAIAWENTVATVGFRVG
jgi:hypothetical protein